MSKWEKLKHFSESEKDIYGRPAWGSPDRISFFTLFILNKITDKIKNFVQEKYNKKACCLIHCAYQERTTGGYHPKGTALDFHFTVIAPFEAYKIIIEVLQDYELENFVGLGVYPDWANQGFHLDIRIPNDSIPDRWSQINGKYTNIEKGISLLKGA